MNNITVSDSCFEDMIKGGNLYVDKTEYLWSLITNQHKGIYFFSRPRRFGKSLTVSTLKAIFQGQKELFRGLAIYDKYDWEQTYPVLHLGLPNCNVKSPDELRLRLFAELEDWCEQYQVEVSISPGILEKSFDRVIRAIANKSSSFKVVILIDEYDKPIIKNLDNPALKEIIDVLSEFYATLKNCNDLLRFVFITGVSKFSHVSIFSGLNNLKDISMHPDYATMLGYTQKELEESFSEHLEKVCAYQGMDRTQLLKKIANWYDGYRFCENSENVYNPFSIANFFDTPTYSFDDYWFASGTPSSLLDIANYKGFDLTEDLSKPILKSSLGPRDIKSLSLKSLLFQTGYLTIKEVSVEDDRTYYTLGFPNFEVENSFNNFLLTSYLSYSDEEINEYMKKMRESLHNYDIELFINRFNTLLAGISYQIPETREGKFQSTFQIILTLLKFKPKAEVSTSRGRIDHVLELPQATYIIEHKLNRSAEAGLNQIKAKGYAEAYLYQRRKIILLGINYSSRTSKITDWKAEILSASGELERELLPSRSNAKKNSPKKTPKMFSKALG